jgi:hypothetical protein
LDAGAPWCIQTTCLLTLLLHHCPCTVCCCHQGALIFGEKITIFTLGGGLLIFVGVLMVAWRPSPSSSSSSSSDKPAAGTNPSDAAVESNLALLNSSSGSYRGVSTVDDDADATVPLKATVPVELFDCLQQPAEQGRHSQQQQQQHWGRPEAARDVREQTRQQSAASHLQQAPASQPGLQQRGSDVELGVRPTASSSSRAGEHAAQPSGDGDGGGGHTEQQLLLLGVTPSDGSLLPQLRSGQ